MTWVLMTEIGGVADLEAFGDEESAEAAVKGMREFYGRKETGYANWTLCLVGDGQFEYCESWSSGEDE